MTAIYVIRAKDKDQVYDIMGVYDDAKMANRLVDQWGADLEEWELNSTHRWKDRKGYESILCDSALGPDKALSGEARAIIERIERAGFYWWYQEDSRELWTVGIRAKSLCWTIAYAIGRDLSSVISDAYGQFANILPGVRSMAI